MAVHPDLTFLNEKLEREYCTSLLDRRWNKNRLWHALRATTGLVALGRVAFGATPLTVADAALYLTLVNALNVGESTIAYLLRRKMWR